MTSHPDASDLESTLNGLLIVPMSDDVIKRVDGLRRAESVIQDFSGVTDYATRMRLGRIKVVRGRLLESLNHEARALAAYSDVVQVYAGTRVGAEALTARGRLRDIKGDHEAFLSDLALMEETYAASEDPETRRQLVRIRDVLLHRSTVVAGSQQTAANWLAVGEAASRIVVNHSDSPDFVVQRCVGRALLWQARSWRRLSHLREGDETSPEMQQARAAANEMFTRFGASSDPGLREVVAESELENEFATVDPSLTLELTGRMLGLRDAWQNEPASFFSRAAMHNAWALRQVGEHQQCFDVISRMLTDFQQSEEIDVAVHVALSWRNMVSVLREGDQEEEALRQVLRFHGWFNGRSDISTHPAVRTAMQGALGTRIAIFQERLPATEERVSGINGARPSEPDALEPGALVSEPMVRYVDAVTEMVSLFGEDHDPAVRSSTASWLHIVAVDLRAHGNLEEAEKQYRALIERFAEDPEESIRHDHVAPAQLNLGFMLYVLMDRAGDAVEVYDQALASFGHATSPHLRDLASKINASRNSAVTSLQDSGLLLSGLEENSISSEVRESLRERIKEGNRLTNDASYAEAVAAYDAVISDYPRPRGADLRMRICDATVRKGFCLNKLGHLLDSVDHHRRFVEEFGGDLDMVIEKDVALGLGNLASSLDRLGRHEEEIDAYDQILKRWSHSGVPYLVEQCVKASWRRGVTEVELGRPADAERSYAAGAARMDDASTDIREQAAISAVNLAALLHRNGRSAEALGWADLVTVKLSGLTSARAMEQVSRATLTLAWAHRAVGNRAASIEAYEWLLHRGGGSTFSAALMQKLDHEHRELVGNPLKAAWRRLRRGAGG